MLSLLGRFLIRPLASLGLKGARAISPRSGIAVGSDEGAAIAAWADDLVRAEAGGIRGFAEKMAQRLEGFLGRTGSTVAKEATGMAVEGAKKGFMGKVAAGIGAAAASTMAFAAWAFAAMTAVLGTALTVTLIGAAVVGLGYLAYRMFSSSDDKTGQLSASPDLRQPGMEIGGPQLSIPTPAMAPTMGVPAGNTVTAAYPAAVGYTDPRIAITQPQTNWVARTGSAPVAARQGYTAALEQQPLAGTTQQGM